MSTCVHVYHEPFSGNTPKPGGWISQIETLIIQVQKANPDLKVYYGGPFFVRRIFDEFNVNVMLPVVNICMHTSSCVNTPHWFYTHVHAQVSLSLVSISMCIQLGSIFLTCAGMFSVLLSFVLTLPTWKLAGGETFTFMQIMIVYNVLGIGPGMYASTHCESYVCIHHNVCMVQLSWNAWPDTCHCIYMCELCGGNDYFKSSRQYFRVLWCLETVRRPAFKHQWFSRDEIWMELATRNESHVRHVFNNLFCLRAHQFERRSHHCFVWHICCNGHHLGLHLSHYLFPLHGMYVCIYVWVYVSVCTCTYIYIYAYIHICIYT